MLNDIKFVTQAGGLGRVPDGEDHISAMILDLGSSPGSWGNTLGKKYRSVEEAESDGIIEGDASYGIAWYQMREFFRIAGATELYLINSGDATFSKEAVYNFTAGKLRQIYYPSDDTYANLATFVGTLNTFSDYFEQENAPLVIITSVKDEVTAVDATLPDLRGLSAETVAVLISGDGGGKGAELADSLSVNYIPAGGTALGCLARANVNENIGWVGKFPLTQGAELQSSVVSDGQDWTALNDTVLNDLNDKGYIFFRRHNGASGYYVNDTLTATDELSDYFSLENNRTMQKAKREVRASLLPELQSPITVDADGKLPADTIEYFRSRAESGLTRMANAGEISGFRVLIDPDQDVLTTDTIVITIRISPRGVARTISINIGFSANLNA